MNPRTFVGFGFGPIQAGLFLYEAFRSGKFERLVVAEVVPDTVAAIREARGEYRVNVASRTGLVATEVCGVEILNPTLVEDAQILEDRLAEASEIATALPSVDFYCSGRPSVASLIARAMVRKYDEDLPRCVVYTAENHNLAAELLEEHCRKEMQRAGRSVPSGVVQFLNTVIGKMSGVVDGPEEIARQELACVTAKLPRAFLVEEFNRILVTKIVLRDFHRAIRAFEEKPDLLPFEEAKLYGHNAVHALLGYLSHRRGFRFMSDVAQDKSLLEFGLAAFVTESGTALLARHHGIDPLFTKPCFQAYAEDLLVRMTNPFLRDRIERVIRDPRRKLGWDDRLVGTMRLALDAGVTPWRFALGASSALETLVSRRDLAGQLDELWPGPDEPRGRKAQLRDLIFHARDSLENSPAGPWHYGSNS